MRGPDLYRLASAIYALDLDAARAELERIGGWSVERARLDVVNLRLEK